MSVTPQYPLNIAPGGDNKQTGFTKLKNEFTYIYNWLTGKIASTTGHQHRQDVTDDGGPIDATDVVNTPTGNIAATTVQAAINELDTEKTPLSYLDTDGTLAANSDSKLATQKAVKTYVDAKPSGGGTPGFVNKVITVTSNTQLTLTADYANLFDTSNNPKLLASVSLTVSTGTTGANALDTGTVVNSKWYAVWVIAKEDGTVCGLLHADNTNAPTMPTDYIYKAFAGWVKTHSDGTLLRTKQVGDKGEYIVTTATNTPNLPLMASGAVGSATTPTYVAVATGAFVPPTAIEIDVLLHNPNSNNALVAPNANYGAYNSTTNPPPLCSNYAVATTRSIVLESTNIYTASGGSYLFCCGWRDAR